MSLSKKILITFSFIAVIFNVFSSTAYAQEGPWYAPTYGDFNSKVGGAPDEEIFGERYTQAQVYWIVYSLINFFLYGGWSQCLATESIGQAQDLAAVIGTVQSCADQLGLNPESSTTSTAKPNRASLGPILDLALFSDSIRSTRPASGVEYISEKIDIIPTAYAQTGFGYTTLSGTQNLWGAVRNMTYGFMVLVVLVLAFGIMLRVKLNPQTVITIQSAIPRVVIALIAITFSYAIAGLLIDLSYLVQGIVAALIVTTPTSTGSLSQRSVVEFIQIMNNPSYGILSVGLLTVIVALVPVGAIAALAVAIPFTGPVGAIGVIGGAIFLLLLLVAFIVGLIQIIWLFLKTYAILLINIVFGPFIILGGAVNLGSGLTGWVKVMVAQLSVFVVSSILIVVAHIFIWGSGFTSGPLNPNGLSGIEALNPFLIRINEASLGGASLPGLGNGGVITPGTLGFLTALVIILSIPKLAGFVRDSISKPARLELGLGMIGGVAGFIGGAASGGAQKRLGGYIMGDGRNPGIVDRIPGAMKISRRPVTTRSSAGGGSTAGPDEMGG